MIIICDPDPVVRSSLADRVGGSSGHLEVGSLDSAADAVERAANSCVIVLGPGLDREAMLDFAEKAERRRGEIATVLVMRDLDSALLREAMRSGVDDVLTLDAAGDEWTEAIGRAEARLAAEAEPGKGVANGRGRVTAVFSTKGGSGKSLVASNIAVLARQRLGTDVALVDLDLQSGDLAIMLQLMPALSLFDAAQVVDRLDAEALAGYFTAHSSGVQLLAAPIEPSLAEQVTPEAVTRIIGMLPDMFPMTVIDGPPLFTDQMIAALDLADDVVLIGSMDVPSIKNLRTAISTLSQLGHPRDHLRIVLNRADSKVGLRTTEVEKSLGVQVDVQIPSSRDVPLSINQGTPLAMDRAKSPVVAAIRELVVELLPLPEEGGRRSRRLRR